MEIRFDDIPKHDLGFMHILAMNLHQRPRTVIRYDGKGREDHILHYHVPGNRTYYQDGRMCMSLFPGDIVLLPMGSRYMTTVEGEEPARGHNVRFLIKNDWGESVGLLGGPQKLFRDESGRLLPDFQQLAALSLRQSTYLEMTASLANLLSEIASGRRSTAEKEWLPQALAYMDCHLQRPLSIEELAEKCQMSERSFCRKFKEEMGCAPIAYHRNMRLNRAKAFLSGGATLEAAAENLGFTDAAHLSRLLKK